MSWLSCLPWSEGIKKRACRYLLQRYLGQFLEEKLTLDQLTVDLYNGTGCVTNVSLDVQALNELGEQNNLPLEFVDGFISEISVSIPWSTLLSETSYVEVKGLKITVQPRQRAETGTSMFESMWSSMTSSMQLAQECLQQDANNIGNSQPLEGVELFAQTIDSILCRIKVRFLDTVIRLEHVPLDSTTGVAIEMFIKNLEYSDEAGSDPSNINLDSNQPPSKGYIVSAFTTKRFYLEGISFYTDEFPSRARTFSRSVITNSQSSTPDSKNSDGHFSSAQISPIQNRPSPPPDRNLINSPSESNPIMWAKLTGRQELRLKIKQGEGIVGPKVELEMTFGSFISFLSPRQLHVLIELSRGLASPDLEDISNVAPRQTCNEKPMADSDFNRVERELMQHLHPNHINIRTNDLRNTQGWSTGSVDESDNEDEFLPMKLPGAMSDSISTTTNNMDNSTSASSISSKSSTNLSKPHKRRPSADTDPTAETTQFHIRLSSIAVVLLHDDILTLAVENQGLTNASTKQMKITAEDFFNKLGIFAADGYGNKNFDNASKIFIEACQLSHIRLLAAPLMIEGNEKTTPQASSMNGTLTLAKIELVECLIDNSKLNSNNKNNNNDDDVKINYECIELLTFPKRKVDTIGFSNTTDFLMRFKYSEKAVRHGRTTKFAHPRTDINIQIESFKSELDITIVDRISSVLNPQSICTYNTSKTIREMWNQQNVFYQAVDNPLLSDTRIDFKITTPNVILKIRFPIPDLRPLHDMNRSPWWTRSVRNDYITLTLTDVQINTIIDSRNHYLTRHEIQCKRLFLTYTEIDSDVPIEIARSQVDEKPDSSLAQDNNEGFGWPRLVLTIYPRHFGGALEDSSEEEPGSSLDESLGQTPRHQPSPFSSKRIIHESDTPHSESQFYSSNNNNTSNNKERNNEHREGEELIIPGNRHEMTEFIEEGSRGTRIQIEVTLPCLSVQIPSKHIYEQLYNRINTDFLLWEPSAPKLNYKTTDNHVRLDLASTLLQESIYPKFSMCKSGIKDDSDSETDDDEVFQSTAGKSIHQSINKLPKNGQSKLSLSINISQGILSLYTPARDNLSNVIPGQQGEMIFRVEDATIFCVSSYKGNVNLGYVCMMVKNISLNHGGLLTIPSTPAPLRSINSTNPRHCQPTIYRSENGIKNINLNNNEKDMLSVAIRIQSAHQTHHIKTFRVAVGIRNATLRHRMTSSQTSWFTQLTDSLDVIDHPVAGYSPPGVLTELYLHLWNCAIDYRPVYLPLRSLVTLGTFSISSNIAAKTNTSTLRFIAEDVALFLSEKLGNHIDLKRDYVCVMDLGLFELSLRLNEKMFGGAPRVDLRASSNVLHLRTCSDSGRALMQLLTYFASDGDLSSNTGSTESIAVPSSGDEESLLGDESINTLSKSQEERVNSLMEEAMEDTVKGKINSSKKLTEDKTQVEVFFFPDESHPPAPSSCSSSSLSTSTTTTTTTVQNKPSKLLNNNINVSSNSTTNVVDGPTLTRGGNESDDTDEDFCILGEEAGAGIMPRHGVPEVRWLSQEYLRIVDNHFAIPLGKIDLLKAPKNFPPPVIRYTLCEMTLVWHMYGGKDFGNLKSNSSNNIKKNVSIDDSNSLYRFDGLSQGRSKSDIVGFSKMNPNEIRFGSCPNSPRDKIKTTGTTTSTASDWYTKGGPGRQNDILMELQLNKVRFQHETYPENLSEASRQVLLISEIEIRDRLASSHINKFLYQYSSEAKPRQTHANMFAMKAVHIRPDPKLNAQECCLKLSLLPLRLNIDQDSLLFLIDFFTELTGNIKSNQDNINGTNTIQSSPNSKQGTPTHHPPVMSVNDPTTPTSSITSHLSATDSPIKSIDHIVDQNLMILLEDELTIKENKTKTKINIGPQDDSQPVYFRSVVFSPEVLIRLDYQGKRVDLTHGPMAGLLMGLAQLNCSELRLKRLTHRHGLLGFDKLVAYMLTEWLQDIKKNQLPSLLGGVGPMHSLVQLFQGFRDLFWLPIEQYQKDGRIVRGLQRGANSFTTSTALAALELTSRLVHVIQSTAETAYDMVSPGPSVRRKSKRGQKGRHKRYSQPLDIREGMANAYMLVKEGLGETANQLVRVASEEHEQKGVSGAVGGVLRQIPPTVVKPIILATEATNNVLGGMRSQLVPDARREAAQKWRQETHDN